MNRSELAFDTVCKYIRIVGSRIESSATLHLFTDFIQHTNPDIRIQAQNHDFWLAKSKIKARRI